VIATIACFTIPFESARAQQDQTNPPPASALTESLARYVPRQDLVFYLEFQGLDLHAAAWHRTAAYRLLSETQFGTLLEDLAIQAIEVYEETSPATKRFKGVDAVETVKRIARHGFVLAVFGNPRTRWNYVVVLRNADRPEVKSALQLLATSWTGEAEEKPEATSFEKGGRTLQRLRSGYVYWVEKSDLVITGETEADEILNVIDRRRPSAIDHPLRGELFEAEKDFTPVAAGFLDTGFLGQLFKERPQLGLGGLKRMELRWGFDQVALQGVLRVVAPTPRAGVLALLEQPTFGVGSLPRVPDKVSGLTVMSIDLAKSHDLIDGLIKLVSPHETAGLSNPVIMEQQGVSLRKDLLANVDPRLALYTQSLNHDELRSAGGVAVSRAAGSTFSVQIRDRDRVARALDPLMRSFGPYVRQRFRFGARDRLSLIFSSLSFQRAAGPDLKYVMSWPANTLTPPYSALLRPTVLVGKEQLVLAASGEAVERALSTGPRWQPVEAFVPFLNRLPAEMIYLRLADPRAATPVLLASLPVVIRQINTEIALKERLAGKAGKDVYLRLDPDTIPKIDEVNDRLFPSSTTVTVDRQGAVLTHREAIPTLSSPAVTGALLAYLLPAVRTGLDAARRAQCVNNLKQIALAMHNYHAGNNAFPRPASVDENGKPLLSWRVSILPYLGHQTLYNKFNFDEPWDSAHNKELLKEMPSVYSCPDRVKPESFTTSYQVFVGKHAMFESDQDIGIADVTDGTSNTFLVLEAKKATPWTKPDDLMFDLAAVPSRLGTGSAHPGGFNAAMGDGSVRFLKDTIDVKKFRSMITRNLGEIVKVDDL